MKIKWKVLHIFYLGLGIVSIIFGLFSFSLASYFGFGRDIRGTIIPDAFIVSIFFLVSGILLILTYFGFKSAKRYARFTGVIGCIPLIILPILSGGIFQFNYYHVVFFIPSILILLLTLLFWNDIPN